MKITVMIAAHRKYPMPNDAVYLPVQVGRALNNQDLGFIGDDSGDHISSKNKPYSELTALYWGWKNLRADYIGLVHYRRHFVKKGRLAKNRFDSIAGECEMMPLLQTCDIILPRKRHYYIETLYSHYKNTMHVETLDETRNILRDQYPDYIPLFDRVMKRKSAHMFNMFIMKREILCSYCEWLFAVLEELESRLGFERYDAFHARYPGRISELLLDVWLEKNQLKYAEMKIASMERVNWLKKGFSFLMAKFLGKKYKKSF